MLCKDKHIYYQIQTRFFLKMLFGCPADHPRRGSLTNPMLLTAFVHVPPEGHREPCNNVGPLSPAERLVELEQGTF